ncbi:hypothetical protein Y1Q_0019355 [Alligator mississippiensis]|uniref:Reverse transcriptase domain-containing protein n=1 Tax=Alligator mississippiensis TaxID=8496 RepID=A0A151MQW2_ALLMI|nr:hypothetical protein Y1Q_0019355 [Alligator mississippiensis]
MVLDNTQRTRKQCAMAWLDISNALGSIPHHCILGTLCKLGLPDSIIDLVQELYNSFTMTVWDTEGETDEITILSGVKQGYSLSPIIFNLAVELLL